MEKLINDFPQNILDALQIAGNHNFRQPSNTITNVLICGMGGSGIGGKIVSNWIQDDIKIPVVLCHDYSIPEFVNQHSLVIGSSYSGNTEETLQAIEEAHEKGAHIIGICSGGQLAAFCKENNYDYVVVPGGNPPRTALAFSLVQLVNIFTKLNMIPANLMQQIESAQQLIVEDKSNIQSVAKDLATFLKDSVGVIYAGPKYEGVAVRARQQFNENSKLLCWHHILPEMNHNELVGWGGGDQRFNVVFLNTGDLIPRNQKRFDITRELVTKKAGGVTVIDAKGNNRIERSFYLIHLVDWASLYLANLKQEDAMDIKVIDYLKDELANFA